MRWSYSLCSFMKLRYWLRAAVMELREVKTILLHNLHLPVEVQGFEEFLELRLLCGGAAVSVDVDAGGALCHELIGLSVGLEETRLAPSCVMFTFNASFAPARRTAATIVSLALFS